MAPITQSAYQPRIDPVPPERPVLPEWSVPLEPSGRAAAGAAEQETPTAARVGAGSGPGMRARALVAAPLIWFGLVADVLLPRRCAGCGQGSQRLCRSCFAACAAAVARQRLRGVEVVACPDPSGRVRACLRAFKDGERFDIVPILALRLRAAFVQICEHRGWDPDDPAVVALAVPDRRAALARRGFSPLGVLIRRAGIPLRSGLVRWRRVTRDQRALGVQERASNMADAFDLDAEACRGRRVVLIDDVATTGATLSEIARLLRLAGADVGGACALTFVDRRTTETR